MLLPEENIEREFAIISLTLYLKSHSDRAAILAVNYYEDYMNLADDFKQLRADFEALQVENIKLKSTRTTNSVSLPSWINSRKK